MELTQAQTTYLEQLLQTSSIETLSTGLASALLHLSGLGIEEVLTLSLICCATCAESADALSELLSQKKLDTREAAATCTLFVNILVGQATTWENDGNVAQVEDGPVLEGLFPPEEPNPT